MQRFNSMCVYNKILSSLVPTDVLSNRRYFVYMIGSYVYIYKQLCEVVQDNHPYQEAMRLLNSPRFRIWNFPV